MRLLRFLALSFCISSLFLLSSFAQAPQTSQGGQNPSASPLSPSQQGEPQLQKMMAEAEELARQRALHPDPFAGDRGIVIPKPRELRSSDSNRCWSIVTYHFSHGDNPRMEGVTTCTPENSVTTQHADREKKHQPPTQPLLMQTNFVVK
jgi:hypothetical protein